MRTQNFHRQTKETKIQGVLALDGQGKSKVQTGIGYLDHMLEAWAFHGNFNLELVCQGDLEVCPHHSIEDVAIILGETFAKIVGDKKGIQRFGSCYLPMDETLTRTVLDLSGRAYHVFHATLTGLKVGEFPTEMVKHFFYSFAMNAKVTLHQEVLYGENDHHKIESLFKGLAKALKQAVQLTTENKVLSTKGSL